MSSIDLLRSKIEHHLIGLTLDSVRRLEHSWVFQFGIANLNVESEWRAILKGRIALSNQDDGHQFGLRAPVCVAAELNDVLVGRTIEQATIAPETSDLILRLNGDIRLEVVSISAGYEAWQLNLPDSCIIGHGGAGLSEARWSGPGLMVGGQWE